MECEAIKLKVLSKCRKIKNILTSIEKHPKSKLQEIVLGLFPKSTIEYTCTRKGERFHSCVTVQWTFDDGTTLQDKVEGTYLHLNKKTAAENAAYEWINKFNYDYGFMLVGKPI